MYNYVDRSTCVAAAAHTYFTVVGFVAFRLRALAHFVIYIYVYLYV